MRNAGNSWDIWMQGLHEDGSLKWHKEGVPVSVVQSSQMKPKIIADGDGGAITVWDDDRSGYGADVYVQKVDADGNIPPGWAKDGVMVSSASYEQFLPALVSDGKGGDNYYLDRF